MLIDELEEEFIIVVVTHRMQQAVRSSDYTACMYLGEMVELDVTDERFVKPNKKETEDDEGRPEIKQRRRAKHRELSMNRILVEVPKAGIPDVPLSRYSA